MWHVYPPLPYHPPSPNPTRWFRPLALTDGRRQQTSNRTTATTFAVFCPVSFSVSVFEPPAVRRLNCSEHEGRSTAFRKPLTRKTEKVSAVAEIEEAGRPAAA